MTGKGKAGSGGKVLVSDRDIANTSPCIPLTAYSTSTSACITSGMLRIVGRAEEARPATFAHCVGTHAH